VTAGKSEMSARLRNESASAKRGARSGAGQRSTSSLSHARPGCAGADKRKLRNVESRDGLDKDLEMQKEPNGVLISSAGQPSERGRAVDDSNWRFDESFGIAGHDDVATARFRRGCADGVLEVGPAKGQGSPQNLLVNRCHRKGAQNSVGRRVERKRSPGRGKLSRRWS